MDTLETPVKVNALTKLRSHMLSLSESERRVAAWILEHAEEALYLSMSQIAQACDVSDTTVLRMCRTAGYDGFTHLKLSLAQVAASPTQLVHENVCASDDALTIVRKVFSSNIQSLYDTLAVVNEADLNRVIAYIEQAGEILVGGVGGSSIVAQSLYQRIYRLGIRCDAPLDVQLQIMHASILNPGDLAIAISYSGNTKDIHLLLQEARKSGANTVLITGNAQSKAAEFADLVLMSVSHEIRSDTIAARISQLSLVDALYVLYSLKHLDQTLDVEKKFINSIISKSY